MIEDCSVTNNMTNDAKKMVKQPLHLIEIILVKHQEAILEVCKEQQDKIAELTQEVSEYVEHLVTAQDKIKQLEAELDEWRHGERRYPPAVQGYKDMVTYMNNKLAEESVKNAEQLDALLAEEREKCARVCDENQDHYCKCAAAIREMT